MSVLKQKEMVYEATKKVLTENSISFKDGDNVKPLITKEMHKSIVALVVQGFNDNKVVLREDFDTSKLQSYTTGMVSNWHKKDKRLNGGIKHEVKNPGSRAGISNPQIKEVKKLLDMQEVGSESYSIVKKEHDRLVEEHKASRQKKPSINIDDLPEELRHLAVKQQNSQLS